LDFSGAGGGGGGGSCLVPEGGVLTDGARAGDGEVIVTFVRALVLEPTFTG
jgi:hypothetical protein